MILPLLRALPRSSIRVGTDLHPNQAYGVLGNALNALVVNTTVLEAVNAKALSDPLSNALTFTLTVICTVILNRP